jgi:hypothetical protein
VIDSPSILNDKAFVSAEYRHVRND